MTQQERPRLTVAATVISKAQVEDGWKLEVDIPSFQSKFSTLLTRVPPALAGQVTPGKQYNLVLERQRLKPNKDGSYPTDYYYGLIGLAGPDAVPSAPAQPTESPAPTSVDFRALERASIERQCALKAAVELTKDWDDLSTDTVLEVAAELARWLHTGQLPDSMPPPAQAQRPPAPARAAPPPAPAPAGQAPPVPSGGATRQEDDLFGGARLASEETKRTLLRVAQSYPKWTWPRIGEWLVVNHIPQGTLTEGQAVAIIESWRLQPTAKEPMELADVPMPQTKGV